MAVLQMKNDGGRSCSLLFIPLALCFFSSSARALSVDLSSPSSLPSSDPLLAFDATPSLISHPDHASLAAAAAASPIGQFDAFGGFAGPKAISSNLENLSDFGDVDSNSGFERAVSSSNRRADNDPFFSYKAPSTAAAPLSVAPAVAFQRYNPQAASGFNAALTAAAAVPPATDPLLTNYIPSQPPPRPVASPYLSRAVPASAPTALPLHLPGYSVPLYPPAAAPYRTSASVAPAPVPAPYKPKPVPAPYRSSPYRSGAGSISSPGRYSSLHAGKPSGGAPSGDLHEDFTAPQAAHSRTHSFGGDFEGFNFGGSLSERGRGSNEGFDFGSEEF